MRADDMLTATLPLFHVGGTIFCALSVFMAGVGLLIMSPGGLRNPAMVQSFWRLVARYRATLVGAVPTSVGAMPRSTARRRRHRRGARRLLRCRVAAAGDARALQAGPGRTLFEVYGMTEASGLIAIDPVAGGGGAGSVGWALPYTRVVVCRLEADGSLGAACEPHEIGVITVRGPHVSPGYRNPAHDAACSSSAACSTPATSATPTTTAGSTSPGAPRT